MFFLPVSYGLSLQSGCRKQVCLSHLTHRKALFAITALTAGLAVVNRVTDRMIEREEEEKDCANKERVYKLRQVLPKSVLAKYSLTPLRAAE